MNDQNRSNQNRSTPPRAPQNGRRPAYSGSRPVQNGQRPAAGQQRPVQNGARSPQNGMRPPQNGTRPQNRRPSPQRKPPEPPPRRRNEESYVFSRSLSETRERILTERKERLEDARKFRKEDVRDKMLKGLIAFGITLLTVIILVSVIASVTLNSGKIKKNKGEFIYKIGSSETELAYSDAMRGGMLYISMNSIAELCDLTVSGNTVNDLRFYTKDGGWISFAPDSDVATINGYGMPMPAPARISGTECSVPLDFLENILGGVTVTVDTQKNTVSVKRVEFNDSTELEPHYESVAFMLKTDGPLSSLDENKYFAGQPLFTFKNDLTEYESCMNPTGDARDAFLMLLNKEKPCSSDFKPSDITVIPSKWVNPSKSYVTMELNATAMTALEAMLLEMRSEGFDDIYITSAYRSYNYQSGLYNTYIQNEMKADPSLSYEEAKAIVETYSAIPGYSEHHTGLCVDFITTDMNNDLTNAFADKEVYDWLRANAWKFGFVLRYPEDKVDVTGYSYESWHWRFVGRPHALAMLRSGMCFDEYHATLDQAAE